MKTRCQTSGSPNYSGSKKEFPSPIYIHGFCKTTLFICFFPRQQQTRVLSLDSRTDSEKNFVFLTTLELDFGKNMTTKLDSRLLFSCLSVSVRRHSFTRKNTFLSLNKTRERSGRVNSFSAAAAAGRTTLSLLLAPSLFRVRIPKPGLEFTRNVVLSETQE